MDKEKDKSKEDKSKEDKSKNQINIELTEETAEGVYANLAMIAHSSSEFVVDFIRLMPGLSKARVKVRIVITPGHARRLLKALEENILKYENAFGAIKDTENSPRFPLTFGSSTAEA